MTFDIERAEAFMTTHARLLDRQRMQVVLGRADASQVLAALAAYRNPDGGFGWGLEPDLRAANSQPVGAMLALEVLAETPDVAGGLTVEPLLDWLADHTLSDGGLPFVLPLDDANGSIGHWVNGDPTTSSLQMTTQVVGNAHLVSRQQPALVANRWLARATRYCLDALRDLDQEPHAYELMFALRFLDTVAEDLPEADRLLSGMARFVPSDGPVPVSGGAVGETLYPLDFAPRPDRPVRRLFTADAVRTDLERLAGLQQPDGGWLVDFDSASPAAELEWRGYMTVQAVRTLLAN